VKTKYFIQTEVVDTIPGSFKLITKLRKKNIFALPPQWMIGLLNIHASFP